jgi:hypothetical protein
MHVIVLHRKVHNAKPLRIAPIRACEREAQRRENVPAPQRSEGRPQRSVHGMSPLVVEKRAMRRRRPSCRTRPPRPTPLAAPSRR